MEIKVSKTHYLLLWWVVYIISSISLVLEWINWFSCSRYLLLVLSNHFLVIYEIHNGVTVYSLQCMIWISNINGEQRARRPPSGSDTKQKQYRESCPVSDFGITTLEKITESEEVPMFLYLDILIIPDVKHNCRLSFHEISIKTIRRKGQFVDWYAKALVQLVWPGLSLSVALKLKKPFDTALQWTIGHVIRVWLYCQLTDYSNQLKNTHSVGGRWRRRFSTVTFRTRQYQSD